jgi:hypothetical protein
VDEIVERIHKTFGTLEHTEFDYDDAYRWRSLFWDVGTATRSVVNVNVFIDKSYTYIVEVHRLHGDSFGARFILYHLQCEFSTERWPAPKNHVFEIPTIFLFDGLRATTEEPSLVQTDMTMFGWPLLQGAYYDAVALSTHKCCPMHHRPGLSPCEECRVKMQEMGLPARLQQWLQETKDTFETRALKKHISNFLLLL